MLWGCIELHANGSINGSQFWGGKLDKLSRALKMFINIGPIDQILSAYSKEVIRKAHKKEPDKLFAFIIKCNNFLGH